MPALSSHEGGGGWPGGVFGSPPGPLGRRRLFGDGSYSGNIVQGGSVLQPVGGIIAVTGAATVAPDAVTGASVATCDWLIVDGGSATLAPSTNSKGLIVIAKNGIIVQNGGRVHIDKLGKAGNYGDLTVFDLAPQSIARKLKSDLAAFVILGEGAAGGASVSGSGGNHGLPGSAATAMKTGGGGAGGAQTIGGCFTGPGGKGGPCGGGAGGGGMHEGSVSGRVGEAAGPYGGPGGNSKNNGTTPAYTSASGGAGDPVGLGVQNGQGAGGGLLMLFAPVVIIGAGCIVSADGANGGGGAWTAGGSAGGGCVCIVTPAGGYTNNGTVRASGGSAVSGSYANGGAGGAGSVNILTI